MAYHDLDYNGCWFNRSLTSAFGPEVKYGDVRSCAAVGGEPDIRRADLGARFNEYAP